MNELVYGIHVIQSILDNNPKRIVCVYIISSVLNFRLRLLIDQIRSHSINIYRCNRRWLDTKTKGSVHQGIMAKITNMHGICENDLPNFLKNHRTPPLLLVLDNITDPHNVGACVRSASAFGVNLVIFPKNRSVGLNSTVRKVSSGSIDHIFFLQVTNLVRILQVLKECNIWIIGTVVQSDRIIFDSKLIGPIAWVMGSEGRGIRYMIKKYCDELVSIPMLGQVMSLNISVTAGICLFETLRQRRHQCIG